MFSYYGSKSKLARYYPEPLYRTVIEPFAGAAHYSFRYPLREVYLNDSWDVVIDVWEYLKRSTPEEILALPDVRKGQAFDDMDVTETERWILRFNTNRGEGRKNFVSEWGALSWPNKRKRLAEGVLRIKHWKFRRGDYRELPNLEATWFIDPPYRKAGDGYKKSSKDIDFAELAEWCKSRKGQVIVCENEDSEQWLPFKPLRNFYGIRYKRNEQMYYQLNGEPQ